nr:cerebellin-1 isoform X2 [Nothobranchius furzeri]
MWRSSGSTPIPSRMTELLTLRLRGENSFQLLFSSISFFGPLPKARDHRPVQRPHHCRCSTNPPVDLTLPFTLACEQDPEILKLLHLRQEFIPDLEKEFYRMAMLLLHTVDCWRIYWPHFLRNTVGSFGRSCSFFGNDPGSGSSVSRWMDVGSGKRWEKF